MVEKLKRKIHFKFKRKSLFMYKNITILAFEIQRLWLLESLPVKVVEVAIVVPAMQLTIPTNIPPTGKRGYQHDREKHKSQYFIRN